MIYSSPELLIQPKFLYISQPIIEIIVVYYLQHQIKVGISQAKGI